MRFLIFSLAIFLHPQNYKRFAISTIKEIFKFQKFHFSKRLTPQLEMFLLRKLTVQIGQKCFDSLSKRLIYISFIEVQVQIGLFFEISEAWTFCRSKMRLNEALSSTSTITKMALPLVFSLIFLCKHKSSDKIEMTNIVVEFCLYSSSTFS